MSRPIQKSHVCQTSTHVVRVGNGQFKKNSLLGLNEMPISVEISHVSKPPPSCRCRWGWSNQFTKEYFAMNYMKFFDMQRNIIFANLHPSWGGGSIYKYTFC